ncbi:hydrolase [Escherichia coli]|nr:hydrolase [Escherichia coli]
MSFDPTGCTLAHEHLHIDLSGFKNNVDCRLDQYAFICQEMNDLMTRGVRNVIEMTNRYMGRNAQFMLDVMRETGIIAEIGSSEGKITPLEEKVFIAAALAHNQTGRPISTHTSFSTMGLEQLALLQAHGVDLSRVTVGHCDLKDNLDNILKMIDLGAYVQFDTIGKNSYYPDEKRIAMLHALRDRGLLNRVMLSMDITRRSHLKANGGYGYDYLLTTFIPQLRQSGFSQADVDVMLRETPSQFFQ